MADPKMSALQGADGVKVELVGASGGQPRDVPGYAHWNSAFVGGSKDAYCTLRSKFLESDLGAFRFRVTHKSGRGKKKLEATWRTLWPEWDPKDDALPPEEGRVKLEQRASDQGKLTLREVSPGVFESDPLGLVTFPEDRDATVDGKKRGDLDFPLQWAHPRGYVQLEYPVGKSTVLRRSFRALEGMRLLHVEVFVCVAADGTKYFDPQGDADDRDYFVEQMRTATLAYASLGIDFNTFVPMGGGVDVGGYQFRFAPAPKDSDLPTFPGDKLHERVVKGGMFESDKVVKELILDDGRKQALGTMWNEHDRLIRYPRAYPARNPKAVRVFFTDRGPDDSALGVAVSPGDAAAVYFGQQKDLDVTPAYRSCVIYVQTHKRKAADTSDVPVNRDRYKGKFGTGPTTTAHEVGHILGHYRAPGGHSSEAPVQPFLMASSAGHDLKFRMFDRGLEVRRRIYDLNQHAWRTTMVGEPYLEPLS